MFENVLMFERRGCEFWKDAPERAESDVGNYRITTPGEIVPGKDGRMYLFEFGCYDRQELRRVSKTGKPLKHPKTETVMTCAMHVDTEYTVKNSDYPYGASFRNLEMEKDFYKTPRKYTRQNVLDYVNSVSTRHYEKIAFVWLIEFEQEAGANFTPAGKMIEYARNNKVEYENTLDGVRLNLYSGDYKYWFYEIEPAENGKEKVKIYLERV